MTNYNERLDEILTKLDQGEYLGEGGVYTARTAITSLIKELVAEAKPESRELGAREFISTNAMNNGYNNALSEYHKNILKVLSKEK